MGKQVRKIVAGAYKALYGVSTVPEISVEDLRDRIGKKIPVTVIDVREPWEYDICHLKNSQLIPLATLKGRLGDLDKGRDIVVHCKMGGRSARAVQWLLEAGYPHAVNLKGGIQAWIERIDPSLKNY